MPTGVRIAISAALLAFVALQVDWGQTYHVLRLSKWGWLVFALVTFNISMVLVSRRWQLIVNGTARARAGLGLSIAATYSSLWLSNFLPTAFGGDVTRIVVARRAGASLPQALVASLIDRYLGLVTLALMFFAYEATLWFIGRQSTFFSVACVLASGFVVSLGVLMGGARLPIPRRWLRTGWVRHLARSRSVIRALGRRDQLPARVLASSVMACLLGVAAYWGAASCVSHRVSVSAAVAAAALGTLASAVPISLSGWGVREGTVAAVLSQAAGISASDAGMIAFLNALVIGITSLLGLVVFLRSRWRKQVPSNNMATGDGMDEIRDAEGLEQQTISDFGDQWTRYRNSDGYYASIELLRDILEPLLPVDALLGKRIAEIGSGTGRIVNMLLDAGAMHVVAIEPSAAFTVLQSNVVNPSAVTFLNITGDQLPPSGDLDLVVSIGVIHHIPAPAGALHAAFRALKPGGKILAWLYGREGNEAYLAIAEPLRAMTRWLPHVLLAALVRLLYVPLAGYIMLARRAKVPMRDYLNNYFAKLSPKQRRLVMYDQLNPAYSKYYTEIEARRLLEEAGFINVRLHHRHRYSWTVIGERP